MTTTSVCATCGSPLPSNSPNGRCPRCLLGRMMGEDDPADAEENEWHTNQAATEGVKRFGDYEILQEIARGGMGVVYRARQISLNRIVALKMIIAGQLASEPEVRRFRSEAESAANLSHPNIIPLFEVGEVGGMQYFTMKLVEGGSLATRIPQLVNNPRAAVELLAEIARAVHYAHLRGILHRDLKPANILFDSHDIPHVTDFGLAKCADNTECKLTRTGAIVGTPAYMSPEQASGNSTQLTTASDVYSLGVILYEMLTGRVPFTGDSQLAVLEKVRKEDPAPPQLGNRPIDRDLQVICLKCLHKDPGKRYDSAEKLADDLARWLRREPILARPSTSGERLIKWTRRRPVAAMGIVMAAVLSGTAAGVYRHNESQIRRAEAQRKIQHESNANEFVRNGEAAMKRAVAARQSKKMAEFETALIDAQNNFRKAQFEISDHELAIAGLRESALTHFELALENNNWRQAREKLDLAIMAGLKEPEARENETLLKTRESERAEFIRKRVNELMADAASETRQILHDIAAIELISMKDPLTAELLLPFIDDKNPDCRRLAMAALAWIGNQRALDRILAYIHTETATGRPNPVSVQEAAICAVCMLAPENDPTVYRAISERLMEDEKKGPGTLRRKVGPYFEPFARRVAAKSKAEFAKGSSLQTFETWFMQGRSQADAREWTQAIASFGKALEFQPGDVDTLYQRGLAKLGCNMAADAAADFDAAIAKDLKPPLLYLHRGSAKWMQGDARGALADFSACLERDPNNTQALTKRAVCKVKLKDFEGARNDINHSLLLVQGQADAYLARARLALAQGNMQESILAFEKALALNPRDETIYLQRCDARMRWDQTAEIIADAEKAIELNPNSAEAYARRGLGKMLLNDIPAALADATRAIELDPRCAHAYFQRGNIRYQHEDYDGSVADFSQAIALKPFEPQFYRNRADPREWKGDFEGAERDLLKALELDATDINTHYRLARIRVRLNDMPGMLAAYEKLFELKKPDAFLMTERGVGRQNLGDADGALKDFERAIVLDPKYSNVYYNRGIIELNRGQLDEAIRDFKKTLELKPQDQSAPLMLKQAVSRKEKLQK